MKLLSVPCVALLLTFLVAAGCSDTPEYPATDAAITDAGADTDPGPADAGPDVASDVRADVEADTAPDAGPCGQACADPTPVCDEASGQCVACVADGDCADGVCAADLTCVECAADADCTDGVCDTDQNVCVGCLADGDCTDGVCDTAAHSCVECLADDDCADGVCAADNTCVECTENADCADPSASMCDTATNACAACTTSADCSHLSATDVCDTSGSTGVCVECTVDDESACGQNSCDPATNTCTQTERGTVGTCQPCKADSECVADHRCIPMEFQGTQLADGYCLQIKPTNGCQDPYTENISRESLSGEASAVYCSVDESLTTCTAVLDYGSQCLGNSECGESQIDDGACFVGKCTYACAHDGQCAASCATYCQ